MEWVAMPFSRGSSWPRDQTQVSCITIWDNRPLFSNPQTSVQCLIYRTRSTNLCQINSWSSSWSICTLIWTKVGIPWWLTVRNLPSMQGPGFDPWVWKTTWRRAWQSTPGFLPGEFHGLRSLVGYSPCGHKESDTTEWLTHGPKSNLKE